MSANPIRSLDEFTVVLARFDIGASGAHTKTTGFTGFGIQSVARTAAGKYTITFNRNMPVGGLYDLQVTVHRAADAAPLLPRPSVNTYTAETPTAGATVKYETWNVTGAPAQTELANGDKVTITAIFNKTK